MKTTLYFPFRLLLMSFSVFGLVACQSDDETPAPVPASGIRPIAQFLRDSTVSITKVNLGSTNPDGGGSNPASELGFTFTSSAPGKITQVGVRYPQSGQYVVSLWDLATGTLVVQANVNHTQVDQTTFLNITPVALEVNKQYVLSANNHLVTNKSYNFIRFKTAQTSPMLPFTEAPITVVESRSQASNTPVLPKSAITSVMAGYVDFTFVAD